MGGIPLWEASSYGMHLLMGGVSLWEVSPYGRCLLMGGVSLWEVSLYRRHPPYGIGGVPLWEASPLWDRWCPFTGGIPLMGWEVSPYGKCPLWQITLV